MAIQEQEVIHAVVANKLLLMLKQELENIGETQTLHQCILSLLIYLINVSLLLLISLEIVTDNLLFRPALRNGIKVDTRVVFLELIIDILSNEFRILIQDQRFT